MTHGELRIRVAGEAPGRFVLLRTSHSGKDIPEIVREAPIPAALRRFAFLWKPGVTAPSSRADLVATLKRLAAYDGLCYAPTVAAMCISATPGMLHPIPPAFEPDGDPGDGDFELVLFNARRWVLSGDGQAVTLNPWRSLVDALWLKIQERR